MELTAGGALELGTAEEGVAEMVTVSVAVT